MRDNHKNKDTLGGKKNRQGAAQDPVRHSFGIALLEQFIRTLVQAVKESFAVDRLHSTCLWRIDTAASFDAM